MTRKVYTLGFQAVGEKSTPIVFDYDTNEHIYTSPLNYDSIMSQCEVMEVMLYAQIDGEILIMDRAFKEMGRVASLDEVFNFEQRFIRVFPYQANVEHNDEDGDSFDVIVYTPNPTNSEATEELAHFMAIEESDEYAEDYQSYHIWSIDTDDFVGDGDKDNDITILEENILNVMGDDENVDVYPTTNTDIIFIEIDGDVYVRLNNFYKDSERYYVPLLKLPINVANELNNTLNFTFGE